VDYRSCFSNFVAARIHGLKHQFKLSKDRKLGSYPHRHRSHPGHIKPAWNDLVTNYQGLEQLRGSNQAFF